MRWGGALPVRLSCFVSMGMGKSYPTPEKECFVGHHQHLV
jgi:hypothetical protein